MEWVAKTVTDEGIAPTEEKDAPLRYLKSATCDPGFRCSANDRKPCARGAVEVMLVFSKKPSDRTTWRTRPNSAPTALPGDAPKIVRYVPVNVNWSTRAGSSSSKSWSRNLLLRTLSSSNQTPS